MRIAIVVTLLTMSMSAGALADTPKLSDPTDTSLASKGCNYERHVKGHTGSEHSIGAVHVDEGATGARASDFRAWVCHNGLMFWKDTGKPWQKQD